MLSSSTIDDGGGKGVGSKGDVVAVRTTGVTVGIGGKTGGEDDGVGSSGINIVPYENEDNKARVEWM